MQNNTLKNTSSAEELIAKLNECTYWGPNEIGRTTEYKQVKAQDNTFKKAFIIELIELYLAKKLHISNRHRANTNISSFIAGLMRGNLQYDEIEWIALFEYYLKAHDTPHIRFDKFPINYSITQLERFLKKNKPSKALKTFVVSLLDSEVFSERNDYHGYSDISKAKNKLIKLISDENEVILFKLKTNDIGDDVNAIINTIEEHQANFNTIFLSVSQASQSKPTKKFQKTVSVEIETIGANRYRKIAHQILSVVSNRQVSIQTRTHTYADGTTYDWTEGFFLCSPSQQFIKGIVWTMERFSDKETISLLSKIFEKSYEKIPGQGPAAASLGNACVYTLGNMRGKDGLGALSRIKLKLRQNNIKKIIDKYLEEGAKKYKVSVEELKEMAVPDFKLTNGSKVLDFEGYKLVVEIVNSKVKQTWLRPDGNTMKSVPSVVKNSTALTHKLKETRKEVKDIQKVYSAQKQRIDNQFILDRTWSFSDFKKYYFEHGLVNPITKKLVWTFIEDNTSTNAIYLEDSWKDISGNALGHLDENIQVKLWHPINADEETIISWRDKILDLEWKQPIKQVFREIYILTDAEINTKSYSNRMASHILKQHQFNALAGLRGWKYSLLGWFDDGRDGEVCQKYLPEYELTAEYWIDELNQDEAFNDTGIWHYITTVQVKFKNTANETVDMIDVPKMAFTEIMRDVDLFVGVCSVGNDPQWADNNGERQENRDYWQSYSFGDLTEIAKTRKVILQRLLPRLKKIRGIAKIEGKFLMVKGKLRTYKIHIGSGNILMEPNDQYLCIVPSRTVEKTTDKLFIPFEGDKGLSIVLSKAFLLAEDDKITDTTITSQINR